MEEDAPAKPLPVSLPTGTAVAANIKRLRTAQGLAFTELSAAMDKLGRPIAPLGLRHIEGRKRRVDADDLVALAVALGVSPTTLLMPAEVNAGGLVEVCGTEMTAATLWDWLIAEWPFPRRSGLAEFFAKALPPWKLAAVERRIAQRHNADSVAELEEPIALRLQESDGDDK